jgi:recombinational DNA repair ATPase RecF
MASPSNEQGVMSRAQAMNLMLNLNLAQYRLIMIDTKKLC